MEFQVLLNQIATLFIIIFTGYILNKTNIITDEINRGLTELLMDLILPAMIISSMMMEINENIISDIKTFTLINAIFYLIMIGLSKLITYYFPILTDKKTVFKFLLLFANVGYMGIPIINSIYPENGIVFVIINVFIFNLLMWTYGVHMFIKDKGKEKLPWKKIFNNNGVIAIGIGFFLFFTGIKLPLAISGALKSLGDMTVPLSMLIIGASLAEVKLKEIFKDKTLLLLSGLRLLIIPFLAFLFFTQVEFKTTIENISILLLAMPAAANGVVFAEKYEGNYRFAAEGIFLTTLLSLITLPFFLFLIT